MPELEETKTELKELEKEAEEKVETAAKEAKGKAEAKGLSDEEVNKRVEAARKQEKDKLYGIIEELKSQVSELSTDAKHEKSEKERIEKEAEAAAEAERKAKLSQEERMLEQLQKIEEQLAAERVAREGLEKKQDENERLSRLREYKERLLKDAGDEIIPELVTGNSEQEIEHNVAIAKTRYKEIFDRTFEKAQGDVRKNMPGRHTDPDTAPIDEAELQRSLDNIVIDMDRYNGNRKKGIRRDEDYRNEINAKREDILDKVSRAYQRQAGT